MQPQLRVLVAAAVVACTLGTVQAALVAATSSEAFAYSWLRRHPAAQQGDELAELKTVNPDAYAIVKALLTKRSLGLLDPKHPSASFATPPAAAASDDDASSGPAAFAKFASPGELKSSQAVYPEVAVPPSQHNWLNWQPASSAADDDAMVANVLGAVANLKGKVPTENAAAPTSNSALEADGAALSTETTATSDSSAVAAAAQVVAPAAVAAPAASTSSTGENSYLKGLDFGLTPAADSHPEAPKAAAIQGNSYLRGIDFGSSAATAAAPAANHDFLASFSWDDAAPEQAPAQPSPSARLVQKHTAKKQDSSTSVLSSWLGGGVVAKASPPPAKASPAADSNPYTAGLDLLS